MEKHKYYTVEIFTRNKKGITKVLSTVKVSSLGLKVPASSNFDNIEDGKFVFDWLFCDAPKRTRSKVSTALRRERDKLACEAPFKFSCRLVMSKDELIEYCSERIPKAIKNLTLQCCTLTAQLVRVEEEKSKLQQHQVKLLAFIAQQNHPTKGRR